ncbi:hypothetical protein EV177_010265, partial [Coemansia sp. RSA 1804]
SSSSQPSLYNFISSGKKPNPCYRHNHNHNHNHSVSQTQMPQTHRAFGDSLGLGGQHDGLRSQMPAESSANTPNPDSNIRGQRNHASSSPDMAIDMPPPSDKEDDSQPA